MFNWIYLNPQTSFSAAEPNTSLVQCHQQLCGRLPASFRINLSLWGDQLSANIQDIYWRGKNYSWWLKWISFESENGTKQRLQPADDQQQMRGEYRRRPVMSQLSITADLSECHRSDRFIIYIQHFVIRSSDACQTALQMKQVILSAGYEHFNPVKSTESEITQSVIQLGSDVITCSAHHLNTFIVIKHEWCHRLRYHCQCFITAPVELQRFILPCGPSLRLQAGWCWARTQNLSWYCRCVLRFN